MSKWIIILVLGFSSILHASDEKSDGFKWGEKRALNKVINCAAKAINKKKGGVESVKLAVRYLSKAKEKFDDKKELKRLAKQCREETKKLKKDDSVTWGIMQSYLSGMHLEDQNLDGVIERLIDPIVRCNSYGPGVQAGVLLVFGAQVRGGYCTSTDGRSYLALGAGIEMGIGAHVAANVVHRSFWFRRHDKEYAETFYDNFRMNVGRVYNMGINEDSGDQTDYGIGLGLSISGRRGTNLRFIRIGNNFKRVREELLKK